MYSPYSINLISLFFAVNNQVVDQNLSAEYNTTTSDNTSENPNQTFQNKVSPHYPIFALSTLFPNPIGVSISYNMIFSNTLAFR